MPPVPRAGVAKRCGGEICLEQVLTRYQGDGCGTTHGLGQHPDGPCRHGPRGQIHHAQVRRGQRLGGTDRAGDGHHGDRGRRPGLPPDGGVEPERGTNPKVLLIERLERDREMA